MRIILSLALLCCLNQITLAQTKNNKQINNVKHILNLQQASWNNGNLDSFMHFYWNNANLKFVSKKGITYGWQPVMDNYKKSYGSKDLMGNLVFNIKETDAINAKNILVNGSWKVTNTKGVFEGYFTLWFKKIKSNWVIVLDHTS